jgi:hypothetical protein
VTFCSACGGEHAPSSPCAAPHGTHGEWEQVAEVPTLIEARLIALRLEEGQIEAQVLDQTFRQEPLPDVRAFALVRVLVRREKAVEARRLLREPYEMPDFGDDVPEGPEFGGES